MAPTMARSTSQFMNAGSGPPRRSRSVIGGIRCTSVVGVSSATISKVYRVLRLTNRACLWRWTSLGGRLEIGPTRSKEGDYVHLRRRLRHTSYLSRLGAAGAGRDADPTPRDRRGHRQRGGVPVLAARGRDHRRGD